MKQATGEAANPHCIGIPIKHPFLHIAAAIAATSHIDNHGERVSKEAIRGFYEALSKRYYPLQMNHVDQMPIGSVVSARLVDMPGDELGLAVLLVYFINPMARIRFTPGARNTEFVFYQNAIDIDSLMQAHNAKMVAYTAKAEDIGVEVALSAYFVSHIPGNDGLVRVNKHRIAIIGDFKIEVYPKDHRPAHFHAVSFQRNINARINLHTLDLVSMKEGHISNADLKLIRNFFRTNSKYLKKMQKEAIRLEIEGANLGASQ